MYSPFLVVWISVDPRIEEWVSDLGGAAASVRPNGIVPHLCGDHYYLLGFEQDVGIL